MKKGDLIIGLIAIVILAFLGIGYIIYVSNIGADRNVNIYVDNKIVKSIKLTNSTNVTFTVLTDSNGHFVSIEDGTVTNTDYEYNVIHVYKKGFKVVEANCKGQDDVRQGYVKMPGMAVICLPHHLQIVIEANTSTSTTTTNDVDGLS